MHPKNSISAAALITIGGFVLLFLSVGVSAATRPSIASKLRGHILLQVESKGEAWYVSPADGKRYYLKDGAAAYGVMRSLGLGIKNADLAKIPVGIEARAQDVDSDGDGLPDKLEEGLKTNPQAADTDGDGFSDITEVMAGYNPLGPGKLALDQNLTNKLKGKILLQVESKGEAWYLNPADGKRYYLKDGGAAYQVMRYLGLGITNKDLEGIAQAGAASPTVITDWSACRGLADFTQAGKCVLDTLQKNHDDPCRSLEDKMIKDMCYFILARGYPTAGYCENISDVIGKAKCYASIAIEMRDKALCDKVSIPTALEASVDQTSAEAQKSCRENIDSSLADKTDCSVLPTAKDKDECYLSQVEDVFDTALCQKVSDKSLESYCYMIIAQSRMAVSFCDVLPVNSPQSVMDNCYYEVGRMSHSTATCEKIQDQSDKSKDECLSSVGKNFFDIAACEKVASATEKYSCITSVAGHRQDLAMCARIADADSMAKCYAEVAESKKDLSICDQIKNDDVKYQCYAGVGFSKLDVTICDKIPAASIQKDVCYTNVATNKPDASICDKISSANGKEVCLYNIHSIHSLGGQ